jgi:hypothetical protein
LKSNDFAQMAHRVRYCGKFGWLDFKKQKSRTRKDKFPFCLQSAKHGIRMLAIACGQFGVMIDIALARISD